MSGSHRWRDTLGEVSLTDREFEVLQLKARRLTNAEIAEQLFVSITTVKWYVRQIYNKLGVKNRGEAIAAARQLELLDRRHDVESDRHDLLPLPLTNFIGRQEELDQLSALLTNSNSRMVTITGPGGMGKTRLALQAATILNKRFRNGVYWMSFSHQDETEFVFSTVDAYIGLTIATTLGLSMQGEDDVWGVLRHFLRKKEVLIVLDGFDHFISSASAVRELLVACPACRILVTSRERLNLPGEVLLAIEGMAFAEHAGADPLSLDAVNLFLQSARRVANYNYQDPVALATIQRICSRLEGMPLAIELAAEWTRLLPIAEVEQELGRGLEFMGGTINMRTVIDRSWNRLTEHERASFSRLSVFQGPFSREAAHQVSGIELNTLSALYDKSLVQRREHNRYAVHDLLRQYAAEKLSASGENEAVRDAHCAYFAKLASDQLESLFRGNHSVMLADLNNLRAAWQWGVRQRRVEDLQIMLFPMDWFYNLRSYYSEGAAAMKMAVDALYMAEPQGLQGIVYGKALVSYGLEQSHVHGADTAARVVREGLKILHQLNARKDLAWPQLLSLFMMISSDPQEAERCGLECLAIFKELGDSYGIAFSLVVLGSIYRQAGQYEDAQQKIKHGLAVSRSLDDPEGEAHALRQLGHLNLHIGRYEAAYLNFQKEYALWRGLSLSRLAGEAQCSWGETCLAKGEYGEAEAVLLESLAEFEDVGDDGNAVWALTDLVELAWREERTNEALDFLEDARSILERRNDSKEQARWWQLSGRVAIQRGDLENARRAFGDALEYSLQAQSFTVLETILDFANLYEKESKLEDAARLLGFVHAQSGLPAKVIQWHLEPLRNTLSTAFDGSMLSELMEEGSKLDQQTIVASLQTDN